MPFFVIFLVHFNFYRSVEWASLTPKTLWAQIRQEAKSYFNWTLEQDNVDSLVEAFNVNKATLLRSFCQKTGVQILLREYQVIWMWNCSWMYEVAAFGKSPYRSPPVWQQVGSEFHWGWHCQHVSHRQAYQPQASAKSVPVYFMFPPPYFILSTIIFRATDAYNFYTTGQSKIQQGFLKVRNNLTQVIFKIPVVLKCSNC